MKNLYLAAGLALIALPVGAAAQAAQSNAAAKSQKAKESRYCVAYEKTTGSRISKTECGTRAQWAKQGVDIDQLVDK